MSGTKTESSDKPSEAAILERCFSLVNHAMFTVALQRRRVRSTEPEDEEFIFRYVADIEFLIVALRRLRRAAELGCRIPSIAVKISEALADFDKALPKLSVMRNVGEHINDYALDTDKRHHKEVNRRMLQVSQWDGTTYEWLNHNLNVDVAYHAAGALYSAVRAAKKAYR